MSYRVQLYDAFSGIMPPERNAIIRLIKQYSESANGEQISEALDYALKNKPSFGGFIFTAWNNDDLISCVVVNKTGMEAYNPSYVLVYAVLHPDYHQEESILEGLVRRSIQHAKGEFALHLPPDSPGIDLFKKMGFQERYVELRLSQVNPTGRALTG